MTVRSRPERDPAVRRRAEAQRASRKPNRASASSASKPTTPKTRCCRSGWWIRIDPAADLLAVDHEVVGLGQHGAGSDSRIATCSRCGAVNMWCSASQRALVLVPGEEREVDHQQQRHALVDQVEPRGQVRAQRAEHAHHDRPRCRRPGRRSPGSAPVGARGSPRAGPRTGTWRSASARSPPSSKIDPGEALAAPLPGERRRARRAPCARARAPPGSASARTTPPASIAFGNTPNSEPAQRSVRSAISSP